MRHFYFRLILGIVWVVAAFMSAVTGNIPFVVFYGVLGIAFLYSACSIWKKEKDNRR